MTLRALRSIGALALAALLVGRAAADETPPAVVPPSAQTKQPQPQPQPPPPAAEDDGPPKFSLPTETDRAAWRTAGFRLQLGVGFGQLVGLGGAPSGRLLGPILRVGLRLDESWSLLASFEYLAATESGGLNGLRFAGTIEPTWHFSQSMSLALGVGFGGIVEGRTGRMDPNPLPSTLNSSYTFPDASTPLPRCNGVGVTGLMRLDWTAVLGPRSATGFALEVDGQWTGCIDDTGRIEPDTARPIVRRQWWPHVGGTLAWFISWR
jgi:hypothetical protein